MTVQLNGTAQSLQASTVSGLVEELGLPGPLLLIELNGLALKKAEWAQTPLCDGDRLEILRIAAGG